MSQTNIIIWTSKCLNQRIDPQSLSDFDLAYHPLNVLERLLILVMWPWHIRLSCGLKATNPQIFTFWVGSREWVAWESWSHGRL